MFDSRAVLTLCVGLCALGSQLNNYAFTDFFHFALNSDADPMCGMLPLRLEGIS
jgi:hypothetical protein